MPMEMVEIAVIGLKQPLQFLNKYLRFLIQAVTQIFMTKDTYSQHLPIVNGSGTG